MKSPTCAPRRPSFLPALLLLAAGVIFLPGVANGDQKYVFHGYDLADISATPPDTATLRAMVAEAKQVTPPRNGETYIFGYTMWGGSSPFSQLNKRGLEAMGAAAGIEILTADNEWDPMRNVANAQSFARRDVDFVINSLLDVQFGAAVKKPLDQKSIGLIALDIPIAGAGWVGTNNALIGFRAGAYLAQTAAARWGDAANDATLIIASFRLVGPNGLIRNMGQEAGARSVLDLADEQVIWLDMKGTADSGFEQMNSLLGRLDTDKPVLIASFSDEQLAGALRAISVAGRDANAMGIGVGGERLDAVASEPTYIASMSVFPEIYANAAIPTALALLAGREVPASVFAYSALVTPGNVCEFDGAHPCADLPDWQPADYAIDEAAYAEFVEALYQDSTFADFQMLLPRME